MAEIIINKEKHECAPAVAAYIKELKAENARLKELYQKSVGVIAATDCEECKDKVYINNDENTERGETMQTERTETEILQADGEYKRAWRKANRKKIAEYNRKFYAKYAEPVRHGRWIFANDGYVRCSECTKKAPYFGDDCAMTDYCPHCGAKMDGESE